MWHQWFNRNFMRLREYLLCAKKTKITTSFNNFFSSVSVFNVCSREYHGTCVWCCWSRNKQKNSTEIVELSHYFVFFAHKKYSRSFIKLRLNPWCHMDYFNDVLTTFVGLKCVSSLAVYMEGQKALGFHQKYLNLCSEDERRLYLFGTTWGWVINARMIIFGWDTLLTVYILVYWFMHFLQNAICLTLLCCVIFQF